MRKGECDVAVDPTQCKDGSSLSGAAPSRNTASHSFYRRQTRQNSSLSHCTHKNQQGSPKLLLQMGTMGQMPPGNNHHDPPGGRPGLASVDSLLLR